jgi:hypothetical protein
MNVSGLLGILIGLGLLISFAFRGWSVLLLAPLAALIAALFSREPLLAHWTQTFMVSAAGFLAQFFPLFLLGALFGKLMEDSGSVAAIANFMTRRFGPQRAVLAVVLAGALVTYGGVSLFVAFFVLAPMAQELFRAAGIPRRLMPAAIVLGTSTFTMSALPGTPSIQNAIPMPFFGTTPFAAPGLGILASPIMLGFGLWWLNRQEAIAKTNGESFGDGAPMPADRLATDEKVRERATTAHAFDPAEIMHGEATDAPPPAMLAALPLIMVIIVNLTMSLFILPALDTRFLAEARWGWDVACGCRWRVGRDHGACLRDRDRTRGQPSATGRPARDHGRRRQCSGTAGNERGEPGRLRRRGGGDACFRRGAGRRARHRRRTAGVARCRHQRARCPHGLGIGRADHCARCARGDIYDAGGGDRA